VSEQQKVLRRAKRQSRAAQDFVMSGFSLTLVLQNKTSKIINDMAKIQQTSEKITAFGGIFLFWTNLTVFCPL